MKQELEQTQRTVIESDDEFQQAQKQLKETYKPVDLERGKQREVSE